MEPSTIVPQANDDQTHSSMMAWRVHEFGPPNVMSFCGCSPTPLGCARGSFHAGTPTASAERKDRAYNCGS